MSLLRLKKLTMINYIKKLRVLNDTWFLACFLEQWQDYTANGILDLFQLKQKYVEILI